MGREVVAVRAATAPVSAWVRMLGAAAAWAFIFGASASALAR